MNYYEILSVPRDASAEEIRHAYLAKALRMSPERFVGAPDDVVTAVTRATAVVEEAWRVLGDPALRDDYDKELDEGSSAWRDHAEHIWVMERELDMPLSGAFGMGPPQPDRGGHDPDAANRSAAGGGGAPGVGSETAPAGLAGEPSYPSQDGRGSPVFAGLEVLADWIGPHPKASRTVIVPDVCGMRASEAFYAVAVSDLRINFVRLTENHEGGDGTVVDQHPLPGAVVRRNSTLTVHVVYAADGREEGLPESASP